MMRAPFPKGGMLMPTVNEAEIRRHIEALQRGDAAVLGEILADDFVQEWPQTGERVRGAPGRRGDQLRDLVARGEQRRVGNAYLALRFSEGRDGGFGVGALCGDAKRSTPAGM